MTPKKKKVLHFAFGTKHEIYTLNVIQTVMLLPHITAHPQNTFYEDVQNTYK